MTDPLTPEREADIRASAKRNAGGWDDVRDLLAALDCERGRDQQLHEFAASMSGLISDMGVPDPGLDDLAGMARVIRQEYKAMGAVLAEIGKFAASHSGRDGQPVLLAALYRIAEECEAAAPEAKE